MIRILLFEDNKKYREALEDAFEGSQEVFITASFEEASKAVPRIDEYQPDVVVMDIEMPGVSGLDALLGIHENRPETKVMMLTQFEDNHRIFVALCRGAWGYALKSDSAEQVEAAIMQVYEGGGYFSPAIAGKVTRLFMTDKFQNSPEYIPLTKREKEVLSYLTKAYKYQQIADEMFISFSTVHTHIKNIYDKLHVSSKSQAILKAIEAKLI